MMQPLWYSPVLAFWEIVLITINKYINGFVQYCSISSELAMKILVLSHWYNMKTTLWKVVSLSTPLSDTLITNVLMLNILITVPSVNKLLLKGIDGGVHLITFIDVRRWHNTGGMCLQEQFLFMEQSVYFNTLQPNKITPVLETIVSQEFYEKKRFLHFEILRKFVRSTFADDKSE